MRRNSLDLNAFADRALLCARITRMVLLLVCIVLIAMPLTQHLWTWDRFLHGGQDFETGIFLILTSLCLIPVLIRACKTAREELLHWFRSIAVLPPAPGIPMRRVSACGVSAGTFLASPPPGTFSLPLQI